MSRMSKRICRRTILRGAAASMATLSLTGCLGSSPEDPDLSTKRVTIVDGGSQSELGSVTASVADTPETRYTGLSNHETLAPGRGMLFVFDGSSQRTFVMRDMSFSIDIIYISDSKEITAIHNAEAPTNFESGTEKKHQYPGRGRFVLEVNHRWASKHNVKTGDKVNIE